MQSTVILKLKIDNKIYYQYVDHSEKFGNKYHPSQWFNGLNSAKKGLLILQQLLGDTISKNKRVLDTYGYEYFIDGGSG